MNSAKNQSINTANRETLSAVNAVASVESAALSASFGFSRGRAVLEAAFALPYSLSEPGRVVVTDVTVRDPARRARSWTGSFLVDTGAVDSLAPRRSLEAIELEPAGGQVHATADGREVKIDAAVGEPEIMGEISGVVFGDESAEPLPSVTALESAGVDSRKTQAAARCAAARFAAGVADARGPVRR